MPKRLVSDFLYSDLTYKIRGAMYKVHATLGSGHKQSLRSSPSAAGLKENVYHKALETEFELQNIPFKTEVTLPVFYEGIKVGTYRPDFIVDDKVLIEMKAVPFLSIQAEKQMSYYLRGTDYKLGLLVNFGSPSLVIRRKIWDQNRLNQHKSVKSANEAK